MSHAILPAKVVTVSPLVTAFNAKMGYISRQIFVGMSAHKTHSQIKKAKHVHHVMEVAPFALALR